MGLISAGTTIFDAGAVSVGGSLTFIKKLTASGSATLDFLNGASSVVFDSTYKKYLFTFKDIHLATNGQYLSFQVDIGTSTSYDIGVTSSIFKAYHEEDGTSSALGYEAGNDQGQGTAFQKISSDMISDNDASINGILEIYDPANTTFTKQWMARTNTMVDGSPPYSEERNCAGFFNTTYALTRVRFKSTSGNIDAGDICLYGIS